MAMKFEKWKIAIIAKTWDLGEVPEGNEALEGAEEWKSSRIPDTLFPEDCSIGFAGAYLFAERLASTCSQVSAAWSGSSITR
jgi:hypothetical protein